MSKLNKVTNYMKSHNIVCEVLEDYSNTQGANIVFVVKENFYIDVYVTDQLVKTNAINVISARYAAMDAINA